MICSKCRVNRSDNQFIWNGVRHKTCDKCKEKRYQKKNQQKTTSLVDIGQEIEHTNNATHINIDYLEVGDFVANKIQELPESVNANGIADIAYQINLLVNVNIDTQNMLTKEIADLIVIEIEGGDEYLWTYQEADLSKKFNSTVGRFTYLCCQSSKMQSNEYKSSNRKRHMRYDCNGKITIRVDKVLSTAKVDIYHGYLHPRPTLCDKMPNELLEEIRTYAYLTTVELSNHLRHQGFDISKYSHKRIYYWKSTVGRNLYQRSNDTFESSCKLLDEYRSQDFYKCLEIQDAESEAFAFTTPLLKEINNLDINITEIYMDATYKTARGKYELYGIIADVKGTGFPIAYLIMTTNAKASTGKRSNILGRFLEAIKLHNINPNFVFTDKDFAEINAISKVWGTSVVQLCAWHVNRALKRKLEEKAKSPRHNGLVNVNYNSNQAATEFDFIDPMFYPSEEDRNLQTYIICPPAYREVILELVQSHFDMHPLIPVDAQGNTMTPEAIRQSAVKKIYQFCTKHELRLLWAYLWTNWYSPQRWYLWARSTKPTIPYGKTTMKIEAHWSVIKQHYLYRFNQPRLDLLLWTLLTEVIPAQKDRFSQILAGTIEPCWWKDFKKEWIYASADNEKRTEISANRYSMGKNKRKRCIDIKTTSSSSSYFTDIVRWTCSCPAFVGNRFLLCKHLVAQTANTPNGKRRRLLISGFERRTTPPFLVLNDFENSNSSTILSEAQVTAQVIETCDIETQ